MTDQWKIQGPECIESSPGVLLVHRESECEIFVTEWETCAEEPSAEVWKMTISVLTALNDEIGINLSREMLKEENARLEQEVRALRVSLTQEKALRETSPAG